MHDRIKAYLKESSLSNVVEDNIKVLPPYIDAQSAAKGYADFLNALNPDTQVSVSVIMFPVLIPQYFPVLKPRNDNDIPRL